MKKEMMEKAKREKERLEKRWRIRKKILFTRIISRNIYLNKIDDDYIMQRKLLSEKLSNMPLNELVGAT
jgi:hypothetical protein